ncbi:MAG: ABC transporter permease, partial [Dehalococcoidia bacterium]|nr:ABC transporter permease [Dehalococcoidia bacterium]
MLVAVLFAPWVSPHKYQEQQIDLRHLPPLSSGEAIVKDTDDRGVTEVRYYLLGTDHLGRDMVSRLIHGG